MIDKLHEIGRRIPEQTPYIQTEEATKTSFVLPFISALGYDIFNPSEFSPECVSDFGTKKGLKVDYTIMKDGKPIILIECKWCRTDLNEDDHLNQLKQYFYNKKEARFGILTNGIIYRFYSDLDDTNRMDDSYFLELNMLDLKDSNVAELKNSPNRRSKLITLETPHVN